ncbi:MAG: hypothetical protein ABSC23_11575 [Bryobacteraceae bacterium]|jgi:hypothetical protein
MAKPSNVISHWSHLIENFQASSLEFYASVERAVEARAVPETQPSRVEHKEGGLASARRQYLRMHRGKHAFDICAAPFGNGFFVSWWFTEPPLKFGFLYTLAFLLAVFIALDIAGGIGLALGAAIGGYGFGILLSGCFALLGVPGLLWILGNAMRQGAIPGEGTVLAMPLIGRIYERVFAPETFYAMDTAEMYQTAVHNAVLEVFDCMTAAKGVRALTEAERKPILRAFSATA